MPTARTTRRRFLAGALALPLVLGFAACGDDDDDDAATGDTTAPAGTDETAAPSSDPVDLRLGYFPNITHAPALVGVSEGLFEENLPDNVSLETFTFNAGPEAVEALFSESLDITYIGPNPAINAYSQSIDEGGAVRIIAGSTSGGAFLVVRDGIDTVEQLAGTTLATPQLGNTQDVALRSFLADNGFETDEAGGGDVAITPLANADSLTAFQNGDIDGAWVPEPFATRYQLEAGAHVLVDERDLWEETDGEYVTTHIIVRTEFLEDHPDVVEAFLRGHLAALEEIETDPDAAAAAANAHIEELTTRPLSPEVLEASFANLSFTLDPIAASLQGSAEAAEAVGLLDPVDLADPGIYDLDILNAILAEDGEGEVEGL